MDIDHSEEASTGASSRSGLESSSHDKPVQHEEENLQIAQAETRAVNQSKILVFFVLLISTIVVALVVFFHLTNSENSAFEDQYLEDVKKVYGEFGSALDQMLGATDNFMVSMVSHAKYSNSEWPFVTMPDFAVKASKLLSLSKAIMVGTYPLVDTEERPKWENYTVENDAWVDTGLAVQKEDENFKGTQIEEWSGWGVVHNNDGPLEEPGPYLPTWQSAPVVPYYSPYNWNLKSYYNLEAEEVIRNQKVSIGETRNLPPPDEPDVSLDDRNVQWVKGFIGEDEDPTEPMTAFYYPIVDKAADTVDVKALGERRTIGVIAMTMFWREFIADILPEGSNGIVIVIGNECGQSFSYQIIGPKTVYLGRGDRHDLEYDSLEQFSTFLDLKSFAVRDSTYTGFPLTSDLCPHWIKAYPSDVMKDSFTSSDPILFTCLAIIIFLFTSVVFLIYDCLNERRQRKVMNTAVQSSAIVSSLFPSVVRDRLFPTEEANTGAETPKLRLQNFLREGKGNDKSAAKSSPIAELFSDTTVSKFAAPRKILTTSAKIQLSISFWSNNNNSVCRYRGLYSLEFCQRAWTGLYVA